ncbi:hypothetical protein SCHPADRAFT_894853 [Schizopora paradoxa]|uniref:Uncharacterized protein n=1 Tax=Schizopora paradoxa TaxID=27342 RepID=A0A0H2RQV3_9AGAM|nr:hypothetical protein SCHPADRAFT_894853 [Schizopora paradoxa]
MINLREENTNQTIGKRLESTRSKWQSNLSTRNRIFNGSIGLQDAAIITTLHYLLASLLNRGAQYSVLWKALGSRRNSRSWSIDAQSGISPWATFGRAYGCQTNEQTNVGIASDVNNKLFFPFIMFAAIRGPVIRESAFGVKDMWDDHRNRMCKHAAQALSTGTMLRRAAIHNAPFVGCCGKQISMATRSNTADKHIEHVLGDAVVGEKYLKVRRYRDSTDA